jgi:hypothetical protein
VSLWSWVKAAVSAIATIGKKQAVRVRVSAKGVVNGMLLLTLDQKVPITAQPVDVADNPARVAGPPTWTLSDPSLGTLVVATDGLSAMFSPSSLGAAQLRVEADGDLGAGTRVIFGTLDISVESGAAVRILVLAGTPVPK